ncbi:MAG: sigma-70 family RNA polymerase sigma factor [Planctomycetota bacterium]
MTTEQALLPRVAAGDQNAIALCLDRYGGLVWSIARRGCPDNQLAEDAVQDIFLQIWKSAPRFDASIASEKTFIAMIARRRVIDINRKRAFPSSSALEFDQFASGASDASARAETKDEAEKAAVALSKLPDDQQRVIKMSVYEGKSHSTIASETGIALGTVKTHIRRGLISLRQALFAASPVRTSEGGAI